MNQPPTEQSQLRLLITCPHEQAIDLETRDGALRRFRGEAITRPPCKWCPDCGALIEISAVSVGASGTLMPRADQPDRSYRPQAIFAFATALDAFFEKAREQSEWKTRLAEELRAFADNLVPPEKKT